jgi:aminopeptidase N
MKIIPMKISYSILFIAFLLLTNFTYSQTISCQSLKTSGISSTPIYYSPENLRSDTIDILKYTINLDITDFTNQKIKGNTVVRFAPKMNTQTKLRLDLLRLQIDSIKQNTTNLTYNYNDTLLKINLPVALNTTDTSEVTVYYQGTPQGDPSGWGGFSFSGNYAYNLGVGFGAKPHNYGRVWFPCFDNFVEKSKYEFNITTDTAKRAYCNGLLTSDVKVGNKRTRQWILNKEIPSYIASVAVADYTQVNWTVNAANGSLPIVLAAHPSDTIALKNGFVHLPNAILGYENYYGPYVWNRVGYCLVPFSSGAMEHVTNIAYPQAAIAIAYESQIMAHELSHHWWGDLMTCETQEDMWLNEGMASYSERTFLEWTYNYAKYLAEVKLIHDDLIKYVHLKEKGFRAISGVPFEYTYGDHVYKKGSDVAHTLRTYMGDAAFFTGLKYVLQQKAYKNMNSLEFRNLLQTSSGQNLTDFFNNWVFNGGWPHFSIDSIKTTGTSAPYTHTVYIKQKLHGAPTLYSNVPLEITFMNSAWNKEIKNIVMSGATQSFTMQTTILPVFSGINVDTKISDAISSEYKTIKTAASISYSLGKALLIVSNKGADSSYIRVEHNLAKADAIKNNIHNFRLNTQHYWKIDGILSSGFASKLRFNYDGNKNTSGISYLDTCLTTVNGDSLILLYRKNAADDWKEVNSYTKFKSASRTGFLTVDTFKLGEYVFANGKSSVLIGLNEKNKSNVEMEIFPNPASHQLTVNFINYKITSSHSIDIVDIQGKAVKHIQNIANENFITISDLTKGQYIINLVDKNKVLSSKPIIIE